MPVAKVNNCEFYYELQGSGPDLVLIHGESHGIEMFEPQVQAFSGDYRCLTYYRRGHGRSQSAPYGYSLLNQTYDLACLLDHLDIRRAVVLGVAMSTAIAVSYTLAHPERVRALVLAAWYELDGFPDLEIRRKKNYGNTFADLHLDMQRVLRTGGRQGLIDYMEKERDTQFPIFPKDPAVRARVIEMFASHLPEHYAQSAEFYSSFPNLVSRMDEVHCKVLGICGTDDPIADRPELLAHLPNFRQAWIEGARRFSLMEQPEAFNAELRTFLAGLEP
jgi:3-oxoadipate enol-lactonase